MEPKDYTVVKIEGEYAYLRPDGGTAEDDIFIALALLPLETDVGVRLHYETFTCSGYDHSDAAFYALWLRKHRAVRC